MNIYNGLRFYAVQSRTRGTFGVAEHVTIKIYRSNNANVPACIVTGGDEQMAEFVELFAACKGDRHAIDAFVAKFVEASE